MTKNYSLKNQKNTNSLKFKVMKTKKTIILSIAAIMAVGLMSFDILYNTGEPDCTGSPADAGNTCLTCHGDFAINAAGGSDSISVSPSISSGYSPGSVYTISVKITKAGQSLFGLGFEALKSGNTDGGCLSVLNAGTQTKIGSGPVNMVHANGGAFGTNTHTFTFKWTAPAAGTGTVTFYAAGNAADGDGSPGGDYICTSSLAVIEGPLTTGIVTNNNSSDIKVYPNPASNNISIKAKSNENLNVIMYDLTGREVLNSMNIPSQNNNVSLLNVANGTYILKVYNETGLLKSDKIVVMHQ
jgi:hypothetical protein